MTNNTLSLAIALALAGLSATARAEHYEIFLLAGQSNMDGRGAVKDLTGDLGPYAKPNTKILIHFSAGGLHRPLTVCKGFVPLGPGYSATPGAKPLLLPSKTFGPEVSFGATIAEALPGTHVLLVKFVEGGTNLHSDWNPKEKGKLYENFINFVRTTQDMIKTQGDTCEIRGMLWHQGESDAGLPAGQYQAALTEFIGRVRGDLAIKELPFVIGQVYDNGKRANVIAGEKAVAKAVPHTGFASADGLTTSDRGTHFDARSQIELGKRLACEMARLLAPAVPSATRQFRADAADMPLYTLPDILTTMDGSKIATADDWRRIRRPEILELFRKHVYGRVPATPFKEQFRVAKEDPQAMDGAATLKQVEITITAGGKSLTIHLLLFVPNQAAKPVPTFLLICNRSPDNIDPTRRVKSEFWPAEEVIARGYGIAAFFNGDVAPDKKDSFREGIHGLLDGGNRPPDAWGTLAAWAWGASRCMDYFETDKDVARDKVAVIGHSRGGKTALWAGAEDERFAMVCSNDSGCGGAALSRRQNAEKETVARINKAFPYWFNENFKTYGGREGSLPVDQHMLIALMAPRAVCVASAGGDLWADPRGEFLSAALAGPAYRLFGKQGLGPSPTMPAIGEPLNGDGVHYHIREGKHNLTLVDWKCYLDFADRIFARRKP